MCPQACWNTSRHQPSPHGTWPRPPPCSAEAIGQQKVLRPPDPRALGIRPWTVVVPTGGPAVAGGLMATTLRTKPYQSVPGGRAIGARSSEHPVWICPEPASIGHRRRRSAPPRAPRPAVQRRTHLAAATSSAPRSRAPFQRTPPRKASPDLVHRWPKLKASVGTRIQSFPDLAAATDRGCMIGAGMALSARV